MLNKHLGYRLFAALLLCLSAGSLFSARAHAGIRLSEEKPARGDAFLVSLEDEIPTGRVWAELDGRKFPLRPSGDGAWKGFLAIDREEKPGKRTVKLFCGSGDKQSPLGSKEITVSDKKFPEQRLTVDESKVTLSKEDLERALREKEIISAALGLRSEDIDWPSRWTTPLSGVHSSPFGLDRYYNGKRGSYHGGIDIAGAAGSEVKASSGGRVALTGDFFYTGNTVFIDHGCGVISGYFHMQEIKVPEGKSVSAGETVGLVGSTGRSTGPHLHFSTYVCGVKVDPDSVLRLTETP